MNEISGLQIKLLTLLEAAVTQMGTEAYSFVFERTRTKNANAAKWVMTVNIDDCPTPLTIKSVVAARDLVKDSRKLQVLSQTDGELWVGYSTNVEALLQQLRASVLWVPRVQKAVEKTMADLAAGFVVNEVKGD
jgi:hypothetical protein